MTDASYAIAWAPSAQRDLARLPEKIATAAVEYIYSALSNNPHRVGHELRLDLAGHHSARRGDHRIISRIDDQARVIHIVSVNYRADVYRPRGG